MKAVDIALIVARRVPVFPCNIEKRPIEKGGFHTATCDPEALRRMFAHPTATLIGMPTGRITGLSVLDLDTTRHHEALNWIQHHRTDLPQTLVVQTRSGGEHWFFLHQPGLRSTTKLFGIPGIDVRAEGGYVILWSAHGGRTLQDVAPAPWPVWLTPPRFALQPVKSTVEGDLRAPVHVEASLAGLVRTVATAGKGERNSLLFWSACRAAEMTARGEIGRRGAEAVLIEAASRCGLDHRETIATINSAFRGAR